MSNYPPGSMMPDDPRSPCYEPVSNVVECQECEGRGETESWEEEVGGYMPTACPACNGEGAMER